MDGWPVKIPLHSPGQHQLCVGQWFIINEPVQFRSLHSILRNQILNCRTVERHHAAILIPQLHAGSIHVKSAGNQLYHIQCPPHRFSPTQYYIALVFLCRTCQTMPNSPDEMADKQNAVLRKMLFGHLCRTAVLIRYHIRAQKVVNW